MGWLNNGWIIGIATSILSGLLVTWIARILLSKKENREYQQRIAAGNRDVIYAIRPGISEGQIPSQTVISALIRATGRRHGVQASELYAPAEIMEELMKEVMDSSFLSSAKKAEYCIELAKLRDEPIVPSKDRFGIDEEKAGLAVAENKRIPGVEVTAVILGTMTALIGGLFSFAKMKISSAELMALVEKITIGLVLIIMLGSFVIKALRMASDDLVKLWNTTRKGFGRREKRD